MPYMPENPPIPDIENVGTFVRQGPDCSEELLKVLQHPLSDLRDRRIFWLMRMIPSEVCVEGESATTQIGPN